jgi:FHS family glucose/mannose:H+ symporter-like MFS transporter
MPAGAGTCADSRVLQLYDQYLSKTRLFIGACAAMFLFGIVLAVLGVLFGLPEMRERLGLTLIDQGDIFLALFFGVFLSTVIVGPMIDSFGNKMVLVTSSALVAAGLCCVAIAHSFAPAIVASLLLGFGGGGLNTSANALVADLFPENRGPRLSVVAAFYGVGALLTPLLAASLVTASQLLLLGASLAAICALAYLFLPFPAPGDASEFSLLASLKAVRIPGVLLFGVLLFCESGNEAAIGGWTSTYAGSIGATPRIATWILTAYWLAFTLSRLAGAKLLAYVPKQRLVLASAVGSAIGAAVMLVSTSPKILAAGAVIIGVSFAAIYPATLAIAADRYQRLAGTIFGLLFAMGLCGGMLFPWLMGHLAQSVSMRSGLVVPLAGALVISILAVLQSRVHA